MKPEPVKRRTVRVDTLARVEGEGGLRVRVEGDAVKDVELRIYEPPRFFEAFLRGRSFREAPDITARICGICPVAYQMSSCQAMEAALGIEVGGPLRELRRLLYCGEWIESHALHVVLLHAPDFLGYDDGLAMARDHGEKVAAGLRLKQIGNRLVTAIGGREVHPVNVRVGGFYRAPRRRELAVLLEDLRWAADTAEELVRWTAGFAFPAFERDYEFVALRHPEDYAVLDGRLVSNRGLDIGPAEFLDHFEEEQVKRSHALHAAHKGHGAYHVGPLARYSLNSAQLAPRAREAARAAGLGPVCRNPFQSIVVRCVETLHACERAREIIERYQEPESPAVEAVPREAAGCGWSEAPRGLLWHRYRLDAQGTILEARIVPPTSQNQRTIEDDLRVFVPRHLDLADEALTWQCEQAVRNYDPCISCATHFLRVELERIPRG